MSTAGDDPRPVVPRPLIGGRYTVLTELAAGGMATVHIGRLSGAVGFARTVAIKQLHPQFARDPDFVRMFLDEARLAGRIDHPNVVSVLDVVAEGNELYLVMEYVAGESLARLARRANSTAEGVPIPVVTAILIGVLDGLHAAHEARDESGRPLDIVHRDVSPQNILVGVDGVARILDFGIAKAMGRLQVTQRDQLKGKLAYMAPEQLARGEVDRRADVYAASVVAWELFTGQRLFQGDDDVATFRRALEAEVADPRSIVPSLPESLAAVVLQSLAKDRDGRFATAAAMARALEVAGRAATASEVGAWVARTMGDELTLRARRIASLEHETTPPQPSAEIAALIADAPTGLVRESRLFQAAPSLGADSASLVTPTVAQTPISRAQQVRRRRLVIAAATGAVGLSSVAAIKLMPARRSLPIVVAHDPYNAPYGIAGDADRIYWASHRDGTIRSQAKNGDPASQRILARDQRGPRFLVVDDRYVYFTNYDGGTVVRADKHGNPDQPLDPPVVTILAEGLHEPWEIALDERWVYVTVQADGAVLALDKAPGASPRSLATAQAVPAGIALDPSHVYFVASGSGLVAKVPKEGGAATVLASGLKRPDAIAAHQGFVYFTEWDGGTVSKVGKDGGRATVLARGQTHPNSVAVDRRFVYWTTAGNPGVVRRVALDGTSIETITDAVAGPVRLMLDQDSVWWSAEYGRSIVRWRF